MGLSVPLQILFVQELGQYIVQVRTISGLTLCMLGNFSCFFFVVCRNFSTSLFSKYSLRNNIRVSNSLDPYCARCFVGPDLGPNCLQR